MSATGVDFIEMKFLINSMSTFKLTSFPQPIDLLNNILNIKCAQQNDLVLMKGKTQLNVLYGNFIYH